MQKQNIRRDSTQRVTGVIICPSCREHSLAPESFNPGVAGATKEGQNRKTPLWPHLTEVLTPQEREMPCGFSLIELLVVVLIIGVLAAVALPQYQRTVEKARMAEAVVNVRAIAEAHQLYYLAHGEYLGPNDMEKLDITIPGGQIKGKRVATQYFYYSPNGVKNGGPQLETHLALAWNYRKTNNSIIETYMIYISQANPQRISCVASKEASSIQNSLCKQLSEKGTL